MDAMDVFQFSRVVERDKKLQQKQNPNPKPPSLSPSKKSFSSSFSIGNTPDTSPTKKSPTRKLQKVQPQAQSPVQKQIQSLNSISDLSTTSKEESITMSSAVQSGKFGSFTSPDSDDTNPYQRGCFQTASRVASSPVASLDDLFTYSPPDDCLSEDSSLEFGSANCSPREKPARKKLLTPKDKKSAKSSKGDVTDLQLSRSASSSTVAASTNGSVYSDASFSIISSKLRFFDGSRSSSKKDIPSLTRNASEGSCSIATDSADASMISFKKQISSPLESTSSYRDDSTNPVQSPSSTTPIANQFMFKPGPPTSVPQISRRMPSLNRPHWSENLVSTPSMASFHNACSNPTTPILTTEAFRVTPPSSYQRMLQQKSRPGTPKEHLPSSPLASLLELPLDDILPNTRPLTLYGSPREGSAESRQSYGSGKDTEAADVAGVGLGIRMDIIDKHERKINSFSSPVTEESDCIRSRVELKRRATDEAPKQDYFTQDCFPRSDTHESGITPRSCSNVSIDGIPEDGYQRLGLHRTPVSRAGIETDNISLIEQLLEENYRGQAETFSRTSSRSSSLHRRCFTAGASPYENCRPSATFSGKRSATISAPAAARAYETPTRQGKNESFAASQRSASLGASLKKSHIDNNNNGTASSIQSPSRPVFIEAYQQSGLSPPEVPESPRTYAHRIYQLPTSGPPHIVKRQNRKDPDPTAWDHLFYFTKDESLAIQEAVLDKQRSCLKHLDCTDCRELEYSFLENKAMPTSMPPEERQKVINNNRSLRNIKNELENLSEAGAITDDAYDQIMSMLPSETSLNASARSVASPSPAPVAAATNAFANMRVNNDPPPPAYTTPTAPSLPSRGSSKPEIARATALYRYTEAEDCTFEVGDEISVFEYMNADWWLGKNVRTGKEGVFPVNYVQVQTTQPSPHGAYGNEKANGYPGHVQSPPPPGPSNPYNSSVPPMAVAEQPAGNKVPGKGGEMGKKFGKKLGNAAIFGAGASIGGNIVNSIF